MSINKGAIQKPTAVGPPNNESDFQLLDLRSLVLEKTRTKLRSAWRSVYVCEEGVF